MTVESEILGGGLPLTDPTTLAGAQRKLFDVVMGTMVPWANAGFQSTTGDGRLIGSFNPFLLNPAVASHPRWRPPQGLPPVARKAGISEDAIRTLARGGLSGDLREHEKIAARVPLQLSTKHRIDDGLYREAEQVFGRQGLFDIAALIGIYHTVCTTLTMFAIPAPAQDRQ
jgi:4-carboxymuconolactone decarboxylase